MNMLIANTKNEFYKLVTKKKYIVLAVISAAICFMRYGGKALLEKLSGGNLILRSNVIMEMLPMVAEIIVPLVVFMCVTDLFCSEMQEDCIKAVLMRPISRLKVMTSKILASYFMGIAYFAVIFLVCVIVQIITGGKLASVIITSAASYLIDIIPMFSLVLMGTLINMIAAGPTLAMLLCIAVYAVFKYMNYFISPFGQLIFTNYLGWHKLWIGKTIPIYALSMNILIILGTMLIFYTLSYILFDRKEI